jgi:hypothetical protein
MRIISNPKKVMIEFIDFHESCLARKKPAVNPKVIITHINIIEPLSILVFAVFILECLTSISRNSEKAKTIDIKIMI